MLKNKQVTEEDEPLLEAISPIVNELIDRNYENSQDKIAKQMAPLIGGAIREQIKNQKDEVVDALYPVLGNMISRYVSKTFEEMLKTINQQIQSGLSAKTIKRKIQAKMQGVSETELLLRENAGANVRALLLIHKETGTVLTLAENPDAPIHEPEMLASMMSAIQSFVNDWVNQNEENNELGEIEFGGSKIIIESSGYAFLAVITDGSTNRSTYDNIRHVLESIVVENGDDIREFNGDLNSFPNIEIYQKISTLLSSKNSPEIKEKKHPLMFIIPLLLLTLIGWFFYNSYVNEKILNSAKNILYKTPQLSSYRISASLDDDIITIDGKIPSKYHKELAESKLREIKEIKDVKNNLVIVNIQDDPMQISSNIFYLISGYSLSNNLSLKYSYEYPSLIVEGEMKSQKDKEKLLKALQKIDGVSEIEDKIKIVLPDINTTVYFKNASFEVEDAEIIKLNKLIDILKPLDANLTLHVDGYTDSSGSPEINKKIVLRRAKVVVTYLKGIGNISQTIVINKKIDTAQKSRCAIISLKE